MMKRHREDFWPAGLWEDDAGYRFDDEHTNDDGEVTYEQYRSAAGAVGRNNAPALLSELYGQGQLDLWSCPGAVIDAWTGHDWPTRVLPPSDWVDYFEEAGYTHNGKPAPRPVEPVTVYRGCSHDARHGMSWTTDLDMAKRFASGEMWAYPIKGNVYIATIEPTHLLAYVDKERRGEAEYVVDPIALSDDTVKIHPV
ncbi:hypothetical protein H7J07_00455 [Mycobacterium koreense]|uniref:Uncharacterized protein n=1 Tax=Mycolicibacillus koreensis TaxID=1069220 RepID=A0A7I7S8B2_9MYCO|nr:hypothetical protein [Mycolicibacillus koreensis]MCV7246730.1 hypothetical protein [Mycolicibacillus koreensis]OSC28138.1 hypothetical protein B8W67_17800 [Mycolicibacillus koreensis]BBY52933.1 hypothetical protein MKOR_01840 [Mycolicibacillus koreensis]